MRSSTTHSLNASSSFPWNSLEECPGEVTIHQLPCHFPSLLLAARLWVTRDGIFERTCPSMAYSPLHFSDRSHGMISYGDTPCSWRFHDTSSLYKHQRGHPTISQDAITKTGTQT